jgi:hypothetical protein
MRRVVSVLAAVVFLTVGFVPAASADMSVYYLFHNANSTYCMSAKGGVMANGTKVIQWPCNKTAKDQQWYSDAGQLKNRKDPSFCLSSPNNWTSPGVQLTIWKCQGATGQRWVRTTSAEGYPLIYNVASGRIAAVGGASLTAGAAVVQWDWELKAEQVWYAERFFSV